MTYKMLSSLNNKLIEMLYSEIPEFKEFAKEYIFDVFHMDAYTIYGPFGSFLRDKILENSDEDYLISKGFNLINNLCDRKNDDIDQMLKSTFFEPLTDYKITIIESQRFLTGKAKDLFNEVLTNSIFKGGKYSL